MKAFTKHISDETNMRAFAATLASCCDAPAILFFVGNLGAGKTTFIRGFIQSLGFTGKVKSPTYTLVEPYKINEMDIYHFDLYRLNDPEELEFIGINDYFHAKAISLIEWPERAEGKLPQADLTCYIEADSNKRNIKLEPHTPKGIAIVKKLDVI